MRFFFASLLALSFCTVANAQGQLLRVSSVGGPGVDATEISAALELANDGDLILVEAGGYAPFEVNGKSVTIQAQSGAAILPEFEGPPTVAITIANLAPGQSVVLRDFTVFQFGNEVPAIEMRDCDGPIALEEIFVDFLGGFRGVDIRDCASVTMLFTHIQMSGLTPESGDPAEAPALDILRSNVFASSFLANGPQGFGAAQGESGVIPPTDGGPGVRVRGSTLRLTGEIGGGRGGSVFTGCFVGGNGGTGLVVEDEPGRPSFVVLRNSLVIGGGGGVVDAGCGMQNGQHGEDIDQVSGTVEIDPTVTRGFIVESPATPSATLQVQLVANAGDMAFLLVGVEPIGGLFLPANGVVVHTLPIAVVSLGMLTQQVSQLELPTPPVAGMLGFRGFHMQALFLGGGELELSAPSHTVLVP